MSLASCISCPANGTLQPSINSVAAASESASPGWSPAVVVSAHEDGSLRLWDSRANAQPVSFVAAKRVPGGDALQVAICADAAAPSSVLISGPFALCVDWRNPSAGPVRLWEHPASTDLSAIDVAALTQIPGLMSSTGRGFAVVDDDGAVFLLRDSAEDVARFVPSLATSFGKHDSVPCGVGSIVVSRSGDHADDHDSNHNGSFVVVTVGMEGAAKAWHVPSPLHTSSSSASSAAAATLRGTVSVGDYRVTDGNNLSSGSGGHGGGRMANPPLPTCADIRPDGAMLVGRGDGGLVVTRWHPSSDGFGPSPPTSLATSPLGNGLAGVAWCAEASRDLALTVSVAGEVNIWPVALPNTSAGEVVASGGDSDREAEADGEGGGDGESDEDNDGAPLFSFNVRSDAPRRGRLAGVDAAQITIGAATVSGSCVVTGDNAGRVLFVPLDCSS